MNKGSCQCANESSFVFVGTEVIISNATMTMQDRSMKSHVQTMFELTPAGYDGLAGHKLLQCALLMCHECGGFKHVIIDDNKIHQSRQSMPSSTYSEMPIKCRRGSRG